MPLALHHSRSHETTAAPAWTGRLASVAASLAGAPARWLAHRRLLATMAHMSDVELRDIGLTRLDIGDAMAVPVGSDPSALLAARAREKTRPTRR